MPDKRYWTTPTQREWLKKQLPAYIEARANHRLPVYWPTLYSIWFLQWPARKPVENYLTDSEQEDLDSHMDVVPEAQPDTDTTTHVDVAPEVHESPSEPSAQTETVGDVVTSASEPPAVLGKRKAEGHEGRKTKKVCCILS